MIKLLKAILQDVNVHLAMIEVLEFNPLHMNKPIYQQYDMLKNIGHTYIMKRRLEISISKLQSVSKYCLSELNGTFYEDHEKQYEDLHEEDYKYTSDEPYNRILSIWDTHPSPDIDINVKAFVDCYPTISTGLDKLFSSFCQEAGAYRKNKDGEIEKVTIFDTQVAENLRSGFMLSAIEEYNDRIGLIHQIATERGSLSEILLLIGKNE